MTQGSGDARKQPLWFFLTTAGTDRNSICWEVHQKAIDILEGRKADSFPVGEHILKSGYDWTADRLADIYIGMDYGGTETHIRIEPWENGNVYESII